MSTSVLFVGGPKDGERLVVEELRSKFSVMVWEPAFQFPLTGTSVVTPIKTVEYVLMPFAGQTRKEYVYALDGMNGDDVLDALLSNYKRSTS